MFVVHNRYMGNCQWNELNTYLVQMDSILNTETKLRKAMDMVNNNLVDSNMFIRSVSSVLLFILTLT